MSTIENDISIPQYTDHSYDRWSFDIQYDLFPSLAPYFNTHTYSTSFPKNNAESLFEKQIENLSKKAGLDHTQFTYIGNEKEIFSFGSTISITKPVLMGPIKSKFSNLDKFLLLKEMHKINNPSYLLQIWHVISIVGRVLIVYKVFPNMLYMTLSLVILSIPHFIYKDTQARSNLLTNDLETAKILGFDNAIKALQELQKTKQDKGMLVWLNHRNSGVPNYEERINALNQIQESQKKE